MPIGRNPFAWSRYRLFEWMMRRRLEWRPIYEVLCSIVVKPVLAGFEAGDYWVTRDTCVFGCVL